MASKFRGLLGKKKDTEGAVTTEELEALLDTVNETSAPKQEEQAVEEQAEPKKDLVYHTATNVFYDSSKRKYMLVSIKYNLEAGISKIESVTDFADSQPTAIYKLGNINVMKIMKGEDKV